MKDLNEGKNYKLALEILKSQKKENKIDFIPLWNVYANFRCPLIGSCLTIEEQRKLIKKTAVSKKGLSDFDAHHILMEYMSNENPVSVKTDRYIRNKYKSDIAAYENLSKNKLSALWKDARNSGEMAGLFYVIATRSDISMDLRMEAFGEIHMLGHTNMYDIMKARKSLTLEKEGNKKLSGRLKEEQGKTKELKSSVKKHLKKITELEAHVAQLMKQIDTNRTGEINSENNEKKSNNDQLNAALTTIREMKKENQLNVREKRKLEIRFFESEATCKILKEEIANLLKPETLNPALPCPGSEVSCAGSCTEGICPGCEICPKRVLMIGGMTKMKPFYRDIVESNGNEFVYHDGYIRNRTKQLNDLVSSSDLILCPVNCNSHNACLKIKKLCKKYNKPYKMLPCSSLSTVSKAVNHEQAV